MKLKLFGVFCASLTLVGASNLYAQGTTVEAPAAGINAPASPVTFSPSVALGARNYLSGKFTNGASENEAGAFVRPSLELGYKNNVVSITASYFAEIFSGRGYGDGKTGDARTFSNNTYIQHYPVLKVSGGLTEDLKLNATATMETWQYPARSAENNYALEVIPELVYQLTPAVSVAAAYYYVRIVDTDTNVGGKDLAAKVKSSVDTAKKEAKSIEDQMQAAINTAAAAGATPVTQLNAGRLTIKAKLADDVTLSTALRAGKQTSNKEGSQGYAYRLQADLSTPTGIDSLSANLQYRLNILDVKGGNISYYNRGIVELSYELNQSWSIDGNNMFKVSQTTAATSKAGYENETYLGTTYKF